MSTEVLEFSNNNDEYLRWVAQDAEGFVLNIHRSLNTRDARLHRARCRTINGTPTRGNVWTGPYIKICADDTDDLDRGLLRLRRRRQPAAAGASHPLRPTPRHTEQVQQSYDGAGC